MTYSRKNTVILTQCASRSENHLINEGQFLFFIFYVHVNYNLKILFLYSVFLHLNQENIFWNCYTINLSFHNSLKHIVYDLMWLLRKISMVVDCAKLDFFRNHQTCQKKALVMTTRRTPNLKFPWILYFEEKSYVINDQLYRDQMHAC